MFAAALTLVSFSSIGLPGLNGFIGEFLVLLGTFRTYPVFAIIATSGIVFSAWYLLRAIQRVMFNKLDNPDNEHIPDLNWREIGLLAPLLICIVWIGVYPAPILRRTEASAEAVVRTVQTNAMRSASQTAALPGGE
jgi:NADH-quinone oxidoreductase subunit M